MTKKNKRQSKKKLAAQSGGNRPYNKNQNVVTDQAILDDMISTSCGDCSSNYCLPKKYNEEEFIRWLYHNLPNVKYVLDQLMNFIFSNNLTTGDEKQDEKLDAFLYAENIKGVTNLNVIRETIKDSILFGKSGLRYLDEKHGLLNVESRGYGSILEKNKEFYGFYDTIGYLVSMENVKIRDIKKEELTFDEDIFKRDGRVIDPENQVMILSKDDLLNLRGELGNEDGESRLSFDKQRTQLLMSIYERLNYDINYDGPGRILLTTKNNIADGDSEVSTGEILNKTDIAKRKRVEKVKAEVTGISKAIKESGSDNVIAISNMFDDITHLPRTTKATEFLEYIDNSGEIISQIFGIPSTLIGLGKISGNVSMEKIIDNAMLNSVIPEREKYAVQISNFLAGKIGVGKIYFDKYEMKQQVSENSERMIVVNMIEKLTKSGYTELSDLMADSLKQELLDGRIVRSAKKLGAKIKNKVKTLFGKKEI